MTEPKIKNSKEFKWCRDAAMRGIVDAKYDYARVLYKNGQIKEAIELYLAAAQEGHIKAQLKLGKIYLKQGLFFDKAKSLKWYLKASEQGEPKAKYLLAKKFFYDASNKEGNLVAFKLFLDAAENGYAKAQYYVAQFYSRGIGTKKDSRKAYEWYLAAAKQGFAKAQYELGMCFVLGIGVEKDITYKSSLSWFEKAAEQGNVYAKYKAGLLYSSKLFLNLEKSFEYLLSAAEKNIADAQQRIGLYYQKGIGTNVDYTKALNWFEKAASNGNIYACLNLGSIYENGLGVPKDLKKAREKYAIAAKKGYKEAQYKLGLLYEEDYISREMDLLVLTKCTHCVEKNKPFEFMYESKFYDKYLRDENFATTNNMFAFKWYLKAAEQGHSGAQYKLGVFFENNTQVIDNVYHFKKWYLKAAEHGHLEAQYKLGRFYYFGEKTRKSYTTAFQYLIKAAEQGHFEAQYLAAECYFYGLGIEQSYIKAVSWYAKGAEQGHPRAQLQLANCYRQGLATSKDYTKAAEFYDDSARNGCVEAYYYLANCYYQGKGTHRNYRKALEYYLKAEKYLHLESKRELMIFYKRIAHCFLKNNIRDYVSARKYFTKAASLGSSSSQYFLGYMYKNGIGVEKNYRLSTRLFLRSYRDGNLRAKYEYAYARLYGYGCVTSYMEAIKLYSQLAYLNYKDSEDVLKMLREKGIGFWRKVNS